MAIVSLSGMAAAELHLGRFSTDWFESDLHVAHRYLGYLSGSYEELATYVEWVRNRARGTIRTRVSSIVLPQLVQDLLDGKLVDGTAVRATRYEMLVRRRSGRRLGG